MIRLIGRNLGIRFGFVRCTEILHVLNNMEAVGISMQISSR